MDKSIASSSKAPSVMPQKEERLFVNDGTNLSLNELLARGFNLTGSAVSEGIRLCTDKSTSQNEWSRAA